jgi:phenylpropionate dioxygenase-like ring-hydroxylating dioxygenase large terminal subunit
VNAVCFLHPVLPEMEGEGWTSDDFVRDFDVDYTLIMENLMDPDHGLFAHQVTFSAVRY